MTRNRFAVVTQASVILWLLAETVHAHPGHDLGEYGVTHLATSPYHLAILAGVGALHLIAAQFFRDQKLQRATRAFGVMALFAAGVIWGTGS